MRKQACDDGCIFRVILVVSVASSTGVGFGGALFHNLGSTTTRRFCSGMRLRPSQEAARPLVKEVRRRSFFFFELVAVFLLSSFLTRVAPVLKERAKTEETIGLMEDRVSLVCKAYIMYYMSYVVYNI